MNLSSMRPISGQRLWSVREIYGPELTEARCSQPLSRKAKAFRHEPHNR